MSEPASHRSRDELEDAIRNLSVADWVRLRKVSATYARGRPIEDEDLLQEAFRRALAGGRKWPARLDLVRFLAGTMKSIAHGELEKAEVRPTLVPLPKDGGADPPHPVPNPEQAIADGQDAAAIKAGILDLFEDDPTAQIIAEGIMEGMEGEELRELTELDKTSYQSKRRYIRRHIDRKFPRGS